MGSTKRVFGPYQIITAAIMNVARDNSNNPTNVIFKDRVGMTITWTGNPVGVFTIMGSMTGAPGSFAPLLFNPQNPNGAPGSAFFDLSMTAAFYIYLVYTPTSGTGTLNAWIGGKST